MSRLNGCSRCQRETARRPYGERNALSSNSREKTRSSVDADDADERQVVRRDRLVRAAQPLVVPLEQPRSASRCPCADDRRVVDDGERRQRQDADHRAHLDRDDRSVGRRSWS
jgi:hypothetical protein